MDLHKSQYHLSYFSYFCTETVGEVSTHFTKRVADNENIWKLICINFPKNADYMFCIYRLYDERVARNFQHIKIMVAS